MCRVVELPHRRKECAVFRRCPPVLFQCRRKIVPVKEHIARIERLERKIGGSIARPLIEIHRLRGAAKEACALPREIIYLLRDLRRHGRIDQRSKHLQRRASRALQEIYARAQKVRIGITRRVFRAFMPRRKSRVSTPRLNMKCREKSGCLCRGMPLQFLDSLPRRPLISACKRCIDTPAQSLEFIHCHFIPLARRPIRRSMRAASGAADISLQESGRRSARTPCC